MDIVAPAMRPITYTVLAVDMRLCPTGTILTISSMGICIINTMAIAITTVPWKSSVASRLFSKLFVSEEYFEWLVPLEVFDTICCYKAGKRSWQEVGHAIVLPTLLGTGRSPIDRFG